MCSSRCIYSYQYQITKQTDVEIKTGIAKKLFFEIYIDIQEKYKKYKNDIYWIHSKYRQQEKTILIQQELL